MRRKTEPAVFCLSVVCSAASSFHFIPVLLPFINPLDGCLSLFVKRLGVNKSRGGSGFSHPHEMSQKGPSEVCCSFEICSCCRCSAQAEEGGGRCSVLGAAQEAADAGRCVRVTWRRCWSRCPAAVICFFFCLSWSHRVSWSTAGLCSTCCWVSPRTLVNRPAGWETACKLLLFICFYFLFYLLVLSGPNDKHVSEYLDHCWQIYSQR